MLGLVKQRRYGVYGASDDTEDTPVISAKSQDDEGATKPEHSEDLMDWLDMMTVKQDIEPDTNKCGNDIDTTYREGAKDQNQIVPNSKNCFSGVFASSKYSTPYYNEAYECTNAKQDSGVCLTSINFFEDNEDTKSSDTVNIAMVEEQLEEEISNLTAIQEVLEANKGNKNVSSSGESGKGDSDSSEEEDSEEEEAEEVEEEAEEVEEEEGSDEEEDDNNSVIMKDSSESEGGWITDEDAPQLVPRKRHPATITSNSNRQYTVIKSNGIQRQKAKVESYTEDADVDAWFENDSDSDSDFIVLKPSLSSQTRFAFPKCKPTDIDDIVGFWELDFQVGQKIIPRMACWEAQDLIPEKNDTDNYERYEWYKGLYSKWTECNQSKEQWYTKFWDKTLYEVLHSKMERRKRRYIQNGKRPRSATDPPKEKRKCSLSEISASLV